MKCSVRIALSLLIVTIVFGACNKVRLEKLEGTWKLKSIDADDNANQAFWDTRLENKKIRVIFDKKNKIQTFIFHNDSLVQLAEGTFLLSESDKNIHIDDQSFLFNTHGVLLDISQLTFRKLQIEGPYFLNYIFTDTSSAVSHELTWKFEKD